MDGPSEYDKRLDDWIPTEADEAYIASLMKPVYRRKIAGWIAPPGRVNNNSFDFEYVKFSDDPSPSGRP